MITVIDVFFSRDLRLILIARGREDFSPKRMRQIFCDVIESRSAFLWLLYASTLNGRWFCLVSKFSILLS